VVAIDLIRENAVFQQDDHLRGIRSSAAALPLSTTQNISR